MSRTICLRYHAALSSVIQPSYYRALPSMRKHSHSASTKAPLDINSLLSKPTWSVRSLLPPGTPSEEITPKQLHHLLRLSALPLPTSPEKEAKMLKTLHSQLHFVRDIQTVDTEGVEPLQSIRDETEEGINDATIGLKDLQDTLDKEQILGRSRRARRVRSKDTSRIPEEDWDVFGAAKEKVEVGGASYFVVKSGKE